MILFVSGKGKLLGYDLNSLSVFYESNKIGKNEIISTIDYMKDGTNRIMALGKFDKTIALMSLTDDYIFGELKAHSGGVTCVKFSPFNSMHLFSGGRRDNLVYCWDLRNTSTFLSYYERKSFTNQRMDFAFCENNILCLGNEDGSIVCYNLVDGTINAHFKVGDEAINNIVIPYLEGSKAKYLFATSGERKFLIPEKVQKNVPLNKDGSESEDSEEDQSNQDEQNKMFFKVVSDKMEIKGNKLYALKF